ncbi:MAG: YaaR family protein [Spirochaetes bacterium]|jgi:uncharacterized protein YaaR (DUF327 family)|nr:YaaR family protein [Spirochaetota bacterium]
MIEITHTSGRQEEKTKVKKKRSSSVGESRRSFSSELSSSLDFVFEGSVDELMDELKDQEKRFLDSQSKYELERYKALVKKIIKTLVDSGLKAQTLKRKPSDRAIFTVVQEIDRKLIEITDAIIKSNKAFNLLKTMEEIRGFILDLVY